MDSDLILIIAAFSGTFLILVATTLGCVSTVSFVAAGASRGARTAMASVAGATILFLPFALFALFDEALQGQQAEYWAFIISTALVSLAIGWPVAHFATKRLDRLTQFDLETFE